MVYVSDHAVLRHLERAYGLDVERIRAEIASPTVELADAIGCSTVIGRNGTRVIIRDGIVHTVLPAREKRRGRR